MLRDNTAEYERRIGLIQDLRERLGLDLLVAEGRTNDMPGTSRWLSLYQPDPSGSVATIVDADGVTLVVLDPVQARFAKALSWLENEPIVALGRPLGEVIAERAAKIGAKRVGLADGPALIASAWVDAIRTAVPAAECSTTRGCR